MNRHPTNPWMFAEETVQSLLDRVAALEAAGDKLAALVEDDGHHEVCALEICDDDNCPTCEKPAHCDCGLSAALSAWREARG